MQAGEKIIKTKQRSFSMLTSKSIPRNQTLHSIIVLFSSKQAEKNLYPEVRITIS